MNKFIINECLRFKKWFVISGLLHLVFLLACLYFDDYEQAGVSVGVAFTLLYGINAMLFGRHQFKTYQAINMWTYLINRPAKMYQLCLGMCAAGALVMLGALVLPYLLVTAMVDVVGLYVIDWRHYVQVLYLLLVSMSFYLTSSFLTLSKNKTAYSALLFPLLILATLMFQGPVVLVSLVSVVWLLLLLVTVFKANLEQSSRSNTQKAVVIVPFYLASYKVLSITLAFCFQVYLMLVDGAGISIAWNYYFDEDTYEHVNYADSNAQLALAFKGSADSEYYQRQVLLAENHVIYSELSSYPKQQQLPYLQSFKQMSLNEKAPKVSWVYSHDENSFVTDNEFELKADQLVNSLGNVVFSQVPTVLGNDSRGHQIITPQKLYFYDQDLHQLQLKFQVDEGESFLSSLSKKGKHHAVLTTAAVYFFDSLVLENSSDSAQALIRLPLPRAYENLNNIQVADLMESTVVSFLYGKEADASQYPAEQISYQLKTDGSYHLLAQRDLEQGFSEWYRYSGYYLSPLMEVLYQSTISPWLAAMPPQVHQAWRLVNLPKNIWLMMLLISSLSVLLSFWLLKRREISNRSRLIQLILVALVGLPGLMFCWLFYAPKGHLQIDTKIKKQPNK